MKKLLSILLALALLASLTVPAFADEPDYTTGTPWPCIDLDGVVTEETTAELKGNFALAVNKDKILALEIPEGYSSAGATVDLAIQAAEDLKNMFLGDAPEGHDARLAYDYFRLLMDWDSRNAVGVAPLKAQTEQVEAIGSIEELSAYLSATPPEDQLSAVWMCGSGEDLLDSSHRIMIVADAELLLGDSAEYAALTPYGEIGKQAITELAEKMLLKLGYSEDEAAQKIDNCFAFETMLAPAIYTSEEKHRPDYYSRVLNYVGLDDLKQMQGSLPILETFANMGYPEAEAYLVLNPAGLEKLNALYTEANLPLLKDYILVHGVISKSADLDRECYEWRNAYRNAVTGATGMLDDATAFSSKVSEALKWPTAEMYAATYLKQEDKDRIAAMIDEILEAYHGIIEEADFLSDETRAKAIEKLDSITPNVLYPDSWEKYSCEELNFAGPEDGGTLWEASRQIAGYTLAESVKEYSEPVDKEKWGDAPQTVNCFYNPLNNSLYILGAYAQGGMYNSEMSDEELLAKLGTVIGHEISHAFDSTGAQFAEYMASSLANNTAITFAFTTDISLSGVSYSKPSTFKATLDGRGHTLKSFHKASFQFTIEQGVRININNSANLMKVVFPSQDALKHRQRFPSGYFSDMLALPISIQAFIAPVLVLIVPTGTVLHGIYSKLYYIYHAMLIVHQLTQIPCPSRHSVVDN